MNRDVPDNCYPAYSKTIFFPLLTYFKAKKPSKDFVSKAYADLNDNDR